MLSHTRSLFVSLSLSLSLPLTHDTKTRLFSQAFRPGDFRLATGNSRCQLTEMKLPVSLLPPSLLLPHSSSECPTLNRLTFALRRRQRLQLQLKSTQTVRTLNYKCAHCNNSSHAHCRSTLPRPPSWGKCANLECEREFALKCLPNLVGQHLKHDLTKSRTGSPGLPAYPFACASFPLYPAIVAAASAAAATADVPAWRCDVTAKQKF